MDNNDWFWIAVIIIALGSGLIEVYLQKKNQR